MQLAMVGLGRMGYNMATRLLRGGHRVAAYNRTFEKAEQLAREEGAQAVDSLAAAVAALPAPRAVWLMLPAGAVVDEHVVELLGLLTPGDILIDGGNTYYKDDLRRAAAAKGAGVHYLDVGVSGGVWGLAEGYSLMVGGPRQAYETLLPALETLAPPEGCLHCGPTGAGHFVKMVHNGIEYGMMQAYAEGFAILEASPYAKDMDYAKISHLWNRGSVIRSWLLELAERAFTENPCLREIAPLVDDSGEGRWTVQQAVETGASAPVITMALMERFRSRAQNSFADRLLAALRNQFGGHAIHHDPD
jgi:6-phosphogluconate dehydrogenase